MTKSKINRLMNELLEKYGDVDVAYMYDYYATRLIDEHGNHIHRTNETAIVGSIKLSQIMAYVTCRSEYEHILEVVEGKRNKPMMPVTIKESKEKYETEEQKKAREKHRSDFGSMIGHMYGWVPFYNTHDDIKLYEDIAKLTDHNPSPKEFGMVMDNHRKY